MTARHIIAVAAADRKKPGLVVDVKQTGSDPLDVRLAASEGEYPYVATLKQRKIGRLKNKATDDEWEVIMSYFLLQEHPEADKAGILENVRIEYSLVGENVHLVIRRDVQGIKQTLGQIELERDPDEEMDPVEWAYMSAQTHNATIGKLHELSAKLASEQSHIAKLNAQLEDFIKTKDETEAAMLQQFMTLLNEKKRKIRDQNRLLAGVEVDQSVANDVQSAREETKSRKPGPSRSLKRKEPVRKTVAQTKAESDEDQMEIDQSKAEEQDNVSEPEPMTPEHSEDEETEDEDESAAPAPIASRVRGKSATSGSASAAASQASRSPPPPTRELPFSKRKVAQQKASSPPAAEDNDETEDEL